MQIMICIIIVLCKHENRMIRKKYDMVFVTMLEPIPKRGKRRSLSSQCKMFTSNIYIIWLLFPLRCRFIAASEAKNENYAMVALNAH